MAQDIYLKIEGIDGESKDAKHAKEIDIASWTFGVAQTGTFAGGGGGGAGKASFHDFQFVHQIDRASPRLILACASGEHIPKATLVLRKAGKEQQEYVKFTFSDVLVSSVQSGGGNSELPMETVSINFSKFEAEYREQKADGTLDAPVKHGWDLKKNTKA